MSGSEPVRIAINAASLINPMTGIGQYTFHLARALELDPRLSLHYFYGYEWSDRAQPRDIPHIGLIKDWFRRLMPNPYVVSRVLQQNRFSAGLSSRRPQLYHEPNFLPFQFDGPIVLTVHDLSYIRFAETHPEKRVRVMTKLLPPAIENAAHILADSEFTRQEIIDEFGVAPDRVTTTLLGVSDAFHPRERALCMPVLRRHGLEFGEYILAVGTMEPRKNLLQVIRAYCEMPREFTKRHPLVIVGVQGWKTEDTHSELAELLADGRARLLGYLPAAELPIVYSGARLFVYPSLYEGFGLPAVEAMASGVPVIVSDRTSLPEVSGDAGIAIAPDDIEGMRDTLRFLGEDEAERERRASLGVEQAAKFSWARCAEQTAAVYLRVLGNA